MKKNVTYLNSTGALTKDQIKFKCNRLQEYWDKLPKRKRTWKEARKLAFPQITIKFPTDDTNS